MLLLLPPLPVGVHVAPKARVRLSEPRKRPLCTNHAQRPFSRSETPESVLARIRVYARTRHGPGSPDSATVLAARSEWFGQVKTGDAHGKPDLPERPRALQRVLQARSHHP